MKNKRVTCVIGIAVASFFLAPVAKSCLSGIMAGVHFRSTPVDFGAPPPKFGSGDFYEFPKTVAFRPGTRYYYLDENSQAEPTDAKEREKRAADLLAKAAAFEKSENFEAAISIYRQMNTGGLNSTSALKRRVLVLKLASEQTDRQGLEEYLSYASPQSATEKIPNVAQTASFLKPFLYYEQASKLYDTAKLEDARKAYEACYANSPTSPLADSALIMAARCELDGKDLPSKQIAGAAPASLELIFNRFPRSRFLPAAKGLMARVSFAAGDYSHAVTLYQEQLKSERTPDAQVRCIDSLLNCYSKVNRPDLEGITWLKRFQLGISAENATYSSKRFRQALSHMSADDGARFAKALKGDAGLSATYVVLRLEMSQTNLKERRDIRRIALAAIPAATTKTQRGELLARIAQLECVDSNPDTETTARKALGCLGPIDDCWAVAQYLVGSAAQHQGRYDAAIQSFQKILAQAPKSYVAVGARETLAYLYDRTGNLEAALDQYYALGASGVSGEEHYDADIAYLLDVKMSPDQIKAHIHSHLHDSHRDQWVYTLGLRYLRRDEYRKAEQVFDGLGTSSRRKMAGLDNKDNSDMLLQDPLQTARDLQQLTFDAVQANGAEAKANAYYRLAGYYYIKRDLLFYNMPLWQQGRTSEIAFSWCAETDRAADEKAMHQHHYEHECLMRSYLVCRKILRLYPRSAAAPKAAYRAACAADRLSHFNPWWRWEAARVDLEKDAVQLMHTVARTYPKSVLAKPAAKYAKVYEEVRGERTNQDLWKTVPNRFNDFGR